MAKKKSNDVKILITDTKDLIMMYRMGYLDGYKKGKESKEKEKEIWTAIKHHCLEDFNKRMRKKNVK